MDKSFHSSTEDFQSSFWDHLEEFRYALIKVIVVVSIGFGVCLLNYHHITALLTSPIELQKQSPNWKTQKVYLQRYINTSSKPQNLSSHPHFQQNSQTENWVEPQEYFDVLIEQSNPLVLLHPTEGLSSIMKISFWAGLGTSCPFWLLILLMFARPGLKNSEQHLLYQFFFISLVAMAGAIYFAIKMTIPTANQFLLAFNETLGHNLLSFQSYLNYTTLIILANIFLFEIIAILILSVHYNWVSYKYLKQQRKFAVLFAFIISAIFTPPDVISQLMLACPMILCYEGAIIYGMLKRKTNLTRQDPLKI